MLRVPFFLFFFSVTVAFSAQGIKGVVRHEADNQPISFVSVSLTSTGKGVATDQNGEFILNHVDFSKDTLVVHFLGYRTRKFFPIPNTDKTLVVKLKPKNFMLREATVNPKLPVEYIREMVREEKKNFPATKFRALHYREEKVYENNNLVGTREYLFKINVNSYKDTSPRLFNVRQLLLYEDNPTGYEVQFMKKELDEDAEEGASENDDYYISNFIQANQDLISFDFQNNPFSFMEEKKFKKHEYRIVQDCSSGKDSSLAIGFKAKRYNSNERSNGQVFLECGTSAVKKMKATFNYRVPLALRPLLLLFGFKIESVFATLVADFKKIEQRHYPEKVEAAINFMIIKKSWFREKYRSKFRIEIKERLYNIEPNQQYKILKTDEFSSAPDNKERKLKNDIGATWPSFSN